MHHRGEGVQGLAPAAAQRRRHAAGAAALSLHTARIAAAAAAATFGGPRVVVADPAPAEVLRPVTTYRGWQLDFTGYVQVDAVAYDQASLDELDPATREPLNEERFVVPRARLRAIARRDAAFVTLDLDGNTLNGSTARLLGAQVGWSYSLDGSAATASHFVTSTTAAGVNPDPPLLTITAGLLKTPFGAEVPSEEREKPFLEPPALSRALFPGAYDAGVVVRGGYGLARWSLGVVNGSPVGDAQWKGVDPTSSYDFVGRIGADIAGPRRLRLELGVSALAGTGLHPGIPPTKDGIQWVDDNLNGRVDPTEIQIVPGSPGEPSETFSRSALGGDATVRWCLCAVGTGLAFVEAAIATNLDRGLVYSDPVAASRDLRQLGYAIGAVQNVGPYAQVGVRYDRYDADRDAMDREGAALVTVHQVFSTLGVLASARWGEARLSAEYDRARNPFGRGDDGAPTTRAADRLTVRAQVGF